MNQLALILRSRMTLTNCGMSSCKRSSIKKSHSEYFTVFSEMFLLLQISSSSNELKMHRRLSCRGLSSSFKSTRDTAAEHLSFPGILSPCHSQHCRSWFLFARDEQMFLKLQTTRATFLKYRCFASNRKHQCALGGPKSSISRG